MVQKQLHTGAKWLFRLRVYSWLFVLFWISLWLFIISLDAQANAFIFTILGYIPVFLVPLVIFLIILGEIYAKWAYKFWKYEFTGDQLRIERGIIWKRYSNIPYQRIQNVDITRGIIARMFGFSSVNIQTAGYSMPVNARGFGAHSEGYLPAVSINEAEQIREFLMKKISKHGRSGL